MTPEDDHRDVMQMTGRRLAHEPWRERSKVLRTRINCAWAHLSSMMEETDLVLTGWAGMDQIRYRYRMIVQLLADVGHIAAGGHAEHVERGTARASCIRPPECRDTDEQYALALPLLVHSRTRWLASDLLEESDIG